MVILDQRSNVEALDRADNYHEMELTIQVYTKTKIINGLIAVRAAQTWLFEDCVVDTAAYRECSPTYRSTPRRICGIVFRYR